MITLKRKINGEMWKLHLASQEEITARDPDVGEVLGVTFPEAKEIYFRPECLTESLVRHELFHAYWFYLFLDPDCPQDSVEETMALWFDHSGPTAVRTAKRFYNDLKKAVANGHQK